MPIFSSFDSEASAVVALQQLSELEQDALSHFSGRVTPEMFESLRGGIMVLQNVLSELWRKGLRLRIAPRKTRIVDLPECYDLRRFRDEKGNYVHEKAAGLYMFSQTLIVVREEYLRSQLGVSTNQRYRVLIHEFAHGIWDLLLDASERAYLALLYQAEKSSQPYSDEYRLKDEFEFFAEGFLYYITPDRKEEVVLLPGSVPGSVITIIPEQEFKPSVRTLEKLNLKLYEFLHRKFKGVIDPELVMSKPLGPGNEVNEGCKEFLEDESGLYRRFININMNFTLEDWKKPIKVKSAVEKRPRFFYKICYNNRI